MKYRGLIDGKQAFLLAVEKLTTSYKSGEIKGPLEIIYELRDSDGAEIKGDFQVPRSAVSAFLDSKLTPTDSEKVKSDLEAKFPKSPFKKLPLYGTLQTFFTDNWEAFARTPDNNK
ncbi:MAG: hypothetical protein Q7R87_03460 [Nanoarchaeota archaeon]|nr:hypothetical protein [Nanoarchaeota archaeon]